MAMAATRSAIRWSWCRAKETWKLRRLRSVNVYVSTLNGGVVLGNSFDVSRMEKLHISPSYLVENVIAPMTDDQVKALYDYTFANCTGVMLYRGDATGMYDTYIESCKTVVS